jgi:hypothetical protein
MNADTNVQLWGAKVNAGGYHSRRTKDWPAWATSSQREQWNESGLVVWDGAVQCLLHLLPGAALALLQEMRATDMWQHQRYTFPSLGLHLNREKLTVEPETLPGPKLALTPEQARIVFELLQHNEAELQHLNEQNTKWLRDDISRASTRFWAILRTKEAEIIDITTRPLPWFHDTQQHTWTCDAPPNRVTVYLSNETLSWKGCLERPHRPKHESRWFGSLEQAMTWGEQELMEEAARPPEPPPMPPIELSLATLTPAHRKRLKPFWIAPSALEPTHLTYRVVIYLTCAPLERKFMEWSFGEQFCHHETYPTPAQLASKLTLEKDRVDLSSMGGGGMYRLVSVGNYAQPATANAQAQDVWDRSGIATVFRSGYITGAVYGILEVETNYRTWIGGYREWPDDQEDRHQFMSSRAFVLTLINALDVDGYDAYTGGWIKYRYPTPEARLALMHQERSEAPHIPAAARAESEQWLSEYRAGMVTQENEATRRKRETRKRTGDLRRR